MVPRLLQSHGEGNGSEQSVGLELGVPPTPTSLRPALLLSVEEFPC